MNTIIANPKMHGSLYANHCMRNKTWGDLAITNSKGLTVNAQGALKYDDIKELTDDIVKAREFEHVGNFYRSFQAASLIKNVPIGKTLVDYKDMNSFGDAHVSMDAANRTMEQTNYDQKLVPLPIFHLDWTIPWRQEGFSYKQADGSQECSFRVMETRDKVLLLGDTSISVNGVPLYGYTNHPATLTETISDWALTANAVKIYEEAVELNRKMFLDAKISNTRTVGMFVSHDIMPQLKQKTTDQYDKTVEEDLMRLGYRFIDTLQDLPDGTVLLIEYTPRTSDLIVGSDLIALPWQKNNQLEDMRFTNMASAAPRIKTDRNGVTGVLYASK
jgi:hypothetical protein